MSDETAKTTPAQDEQEAFEQHYHRFDLSRDPVSGAYWDSEVRCLWDAWQARATRPAQTEQMNLKPLLSAGADLSNIAYNLAQRPGVTLDSIVCEALSSARKSWDSARAALNFQQGKFRMGDLVKKSTGSEWEGRVVGWYSTEQTKEGYAVESSAHRNSVQIYPVTALEAVE